MVNATLWWLLLIPLFFSIISVIILPKLDRSINTMTALVFSAGGLAISAVIISVCFYMGKGSKTADTEIWNGEITGKNRSHGSYVVSYQCNCVQQCSGSGSSQSCSQVCQTCYEDHYTVTWSASSTIGGYTIDHLDTTSRSVYMTPDPRFYTNIRRGEPCSKSHDYTNYIKAVPESLFRPAASDLKAKFAKMVPAYPGGIYDFWHVDRVISVGVPVTNLREWNEKLSEALKSLGPTKQANAIIVLVKTDDPNYMYALQDAWLNGKKNDIVLVIGTTDEKKASWVGVLALTDAEMFKVKLRDDVMALDTLTADGVINTLYKDTMTLFKRKSMKDFAYLDAEIDPPTWVNVSTSILVILAYVGFWIFVAKAGTPVSRFGRSRYNRF